MMTEFSSVHSYSHFAAAVRWQRRFTRDASQNEFIAAVTASSVGRHQTLRGGSLLFRAQLGCEWPTPEEEEEGDAGARGYPPARMKPLRNRASEGRVNPRGIPCLYMATTPETAAAEVRPWLGAFVSVAQMKTARDITLVNCTPDGRRDRIYFEEPGPSERERAVWRDIDQAFSQPIERTEHSDDYAPTQVLAEEFRAQGLDGIAYRSALGGGYNIALFDLDGADVINCTVHHVRKISFDLPEVANRYFVPEHYPELQRGDA
jgi:hypothetical protein